MGEKIIPIWILDGMVTDLKNRSKSQYKIDDSTIPTNLSDMITQVKRLYLFETAYKENRGKAQNNER